MRNENKQNDCNSRHGLGSVLRSLKKNIFMRAMLGIITVVLTIVLIFSLTIAWQTNVVQTGGLSFTTEKWNFNGDVVLESQAISAAPGDDGAISLILNNDSDGLVAAGVNVSKTQMSEEMQKRFYFYTDVSAVRNNEKMNRVYVSSGYGYTYTLFPQSRITPDLHWQWVYDVLGYYVLGTMSTGDNGVSIVDIKEYIRPIEYEFDETRTTFINGSLDRIDGNTTVSEFLYQISSNDGFEGTIDVTEKTESGYYPVDVNDDGYGVWAYLCSYDEIITNMERDTQLGINADNGATDTYTAKITITGYNSKDDAVPVNTTEQFMEALNSSNVNLITLDNDIVLSEAVALINGTSTMIDLNGHTLTSTVKDNIIVADVGSVLLIQNGTLKGSEYTTANGNTATTDIAVYSSGATVILEDVIISDVVDGVKIQDNKNNVGVDSNIRITDSNISAGEIGVYVYGNADDSDELTNIVIENSVISGNGYAGILANGSSWGTNITVKNSNVSGYYTAIYHPQLQNSYMLVEDSTLTGMTGVVVKGGIVDIVDCVVTGTGVANEPAYSNSGWTDTGDGIYVEANYDTTILVTVSGEKTVVTSENALAVRKYMSTASNADIVVKSGSYNTNVDAYLYTDSEMTVPEDNTGMYVVTEKNIE